MSNSWKLDCGPDGTILFGPQSTRYPFSADPKIGDSDRQTQDADLEGVDGALFGIDTTAGQTIAFELTAVGETDDEANALYAAFRKAWRADSIRSTRGAVATLTAPSGRSIFGRPRRITPIYYPDRAGVVGIVADFATRDDLWYGPEQFLSVPLAVSQSGGLVERHYAPGESFGVVEVISGTNLYAVGQLAQSPTETGLYLPGPIAESPSGSGLFPLPAGQLLYDGLKEPLVARGYTTQANAFVVGGDMDTWPTVTIRGQILNPGVEVAGVFRYATQTSLAFDESITISTRPGARSVLRNGDQIASLTRTSDLLSSAALSPGSHTLTLTGSASTGTPEAVISWRAAYSAP